MPKPTVCALSTALIAGLLVSCASSDIAPEGVHIDGEWHLDTSASENPDAKISGAIAAAESKLRQRLANAGYDQYGTPPAGGGGRHGRHGGPADAGGVPPDDGPPTDGPTTAGAGLNGDEYTATGFIGPDFRGLRQQLEQVLYSPRLMTIAVESDSVRIGSDKAPVRDYPVGDSFTRMDEYGTAKIDTKWSGTTFVLRSRYSNKAKLVEHYSGDARTGTLSLTLDLDDPVAGKLSMHSVYRH